MVGVALDFKVLAIGRKNSIPLGEVAQKEPLVLTYVANTGVLVASGDSKVLIDALFDKPNPAYRAPTPEVLDKIQDNEGSGAI